VDKGTSPFAFVRARAVIGDRPEVEVRATALDGVADVLPMQQIVRAILPVCGVGYRIDYPRPRSGIESEQGPNAFRVFDSPEDLHSLAKHAFAGEVILNAVRRHAEALHRRSVQWKKMPANRVGIAFLNNRQVSAACLVYRLPHLVLDGLFPQLV